MNTKIEDGIYTVQYPGGEHRTLRVKTVKQPGFFKGKQKVGYLAGPDNETGYAWVGHYERGEFRFWRGAGFTEIRQARFRRALAVISRDPDACGRAYAMRSRNCYRCDRTLTHPDSLETGIGPECGKRRNRTAAERRAVLERRAAA